MSFGIGLYIGFGLGWAAFTLNEVGFGAGARLLWRVPALVFGWPIFIINSITEDRR